MSLSVYVRVFTSRPLSPSPCFVPFLVTQVRKIHTCQEEKRRKREKRRELRLEAGVESSDVHALVPEQRVEQRCLCCCAGRGAADIIIDITDALAVALFFAVALKGDARVARGLERTAGHRQRDQNRAAAKQRQGDSMRVQARPERHFKCFLTFRAVQRDRDGEGKESKGRRDCRWNPLRALMKQEVT